MPALPARTTAQARQVKSKPSPHQVGNAGGKAQLAAGTLYRVSLQLEGIPALRAQGLVDRPTPVGNPRQLRYQRLRVCGLGDVAAHQAALPTSLQAFGKQLQGIP